MDSIENIGDKQSFFEDMGCLQLIEVEIIVNYFDKISPQVIKSPVRSLLH
ncbi:MULTISPECIES: hypothetical protein [Calothrix]|uniref:Uncharacterized protein n=2 Tax=Calothrix TaxID=1186 RepID=A0ABR8ADM4_9CYAN|nr:MULTISPECIES: hypothetical protein [Calothrix]MBD2198125.1 hypothetical protein [Calothrix parietina FACHB-288]MBD2226452.1 hypothetical protein [Calothrix anomala FACHB-343]